MGTVQQWFVIVGAALTILATLQRLASRSVLRSRLAQDVAIWGKLNGDQRRQMREVIDAQVGRLWLLEQPEARVRWSRAVFGVVLAFVGVGALFSPFPRTVWGWILFVCATVEALTGLGLLGWEARRWMRVRTRKQQRSQADTTVTATLTAEATVERSDGPAG